MAAGARDAGGARGDGRLTISRHASRTERAATAAAFLASGIGIGAWAVAIPGLKHALRLTDGALGLALLSFAVGAVLAMQFSGLIAHRLGTARGTRLAMLAFAVMLVLPPLAGSLSGLAVAAFALGAAQGVLDVLMNAHASVVERRRGAPIMSSFHAAYSAGGLAGAVIGGALGGAGIGAGMDFAAILAVVLALGGWNGLREKAAIVPARPPLRLRSRLRLQLRLPERALLPLAAAALLGMLCEGAIGDWSAVYLTASAGMTPGQAASGYAGFSAAMLIGRLAGDSVVRRLGRSRVVASGAAIAAAGLVIAIAWPAPVAGTAGFALVGLGLANVVPAIYSAAGRRGATPATSIAAVATAGYAGLLAGPVAIGATAQVVGLRTGLALLVACAAAVALLGRSLGKD